jgi:WD40 repeat protein
MIQSLPGHKKALTCLSAVDTTLFSGSLDKTIRIFDIKTFNSTKSMSHEKGIVCVAASEYGVYTSSGKRTVTEFSKVSQ